LIEFDKLKMNIVNE